MSLQLSAHADNASGRPLLESDGTVLRTADLDGDGTPDAAGLAATAQCTVCHDTHSPRTAACSTTGTSSTRPGRGWSATRPSPAATAPSFCHYAGDWDNMGAGGNYFQHGHGMAQSTYKYKNGKPDATGGYVTMGYACPGCHVGLDPGQKAHANDTSGASDQERYARRLNLSLTLQAGDTGSALGNPLVGVCLSCHQGYEPHQTVSARRGGLPGLPRRARGGRGGGSNVMMIPERAKRPGSYVAPNAAFASKAGTELIVYDSTKYDTATSPYQPRLPAALDFFRQGDANGVCDSAECHGGKGYTPLGTWINNAGTSHKGGQQTPGADCNACHKHNGDVLGGWRAQSSCEDCHADATGAFNTTNLPRTHGDATESLTIHSLHAGSGFAPTARPATPTTAGPIRRSPPPTARCTWTAS